MQSFFSAGGPSAAFKKKVLGKDQVRATTFIHLLLFFSFFLSTFFYLSTFLNLSTFFIYLSTFTAEGPSAAFKKKVLGKDQVGG